jgi:hypothetical protein
MDYFLSVDSYNLEESLAVVLQILLTYTLFQVSTTAVVLIPQLI